MMTTDASKARPPRIAYIDLLALVGETNRCPGGKRTVARVVGRLGLHAGGKVLEVGSNTGFTSLELAATTPCQIVGVDVNTAAVREAERRRRLLPLSVGERVRFVLADAAALPFEDESFDVVVCGGANGFLAERERAFAEYRRVLRPFGMVSVTQLFYRSAPAPGLPERLREVLGFGVPAIGLRGWLTELVRPGWELFDLHVRDLAARPGWVVDAHVDALCSPDRLAKVPPPLRAQAAEQWREAMHAFNDNHRHLGYLELTLRRPPDGAEPEQPELFLEPGAFDPFFLNDFVPPSPDKEEHDAPA